MTLLCRRCHVLLLTLVVLTWPAGVYGHRVSGSDTHTGSHASKPPAEATQPAPVSAEQPAEPAPPVRLGVEEKIGGFVPLDLVFTNDRSEQVRLRQLIDRPTLLVPVY